MANQAGGVGLSFTALGLFLATIGFSLGIDGGPFRAVGAVLLIGLGAVLLVPPLQQRFAVAAGHFSGLLAPLSGGIAGHGLAGQFLLGLTLGLVWSPCVGPTLGAASLLAAHGSHLTQVVATMLAFALGATLPLIVIGALSRQLSANRRGSLLAFGQHGKVALGTIAGLTGLLILTGLDKPLETLLVTISPAWLTRLSTAF